LPPPGPTHYAFRRACWLAAPTNEPKHPPPKTASRLKLERLLCKPDAARSDESWRGGVDTVWKKLTSGRKLRHRLPVSLVIKVIHAGWLRDPETWPEGAVVPMSD
ncbi:hypothetical protein BU15DRAFT_26258, partial [Melanogaster broomeanus]